jgi:hypothetical protein
MWPAQVAWRERGEADWQGPQGRNTGERASKAECVTQRGNRNPVGAPKAFGQNG